MSDYAVVKCYERNGHVHRATVLSIASLKYAMPVERCEKFEIESIDNHSAPMFQRNLKKFVDIENEKRAATIGYKFAKHKDLMAALQSARATARATALANSTDTCTFSRGTEYVFMGDDGERMNIEIWAGNNFTKQGIINVVDMYKDQAKEIWLDNGYDTAASPKDYHDRCDYDPAVAFAELLVWEKR
jgi:hypothetical protein